MIRGLTTGTAKSRRDGGGIDRKSAAATGKRESSPHTSSGRRASLEEWLTIKTTASVQRTERRGGGRNQEQNAERSSQAEEHRGLDSPDDGVSGDDEEGLLKHARSSEKTELNLELDERVGGVTDDNEHERQGAAALPTSSRLSRGRISDNDIITGSDDQPLSKEKLVTHGDDDAGIENIYDDSPVGDGVPRQVTFLSGTMGLTVDISDPMQPQPTDELQKQRTTHDDEAPFPASPCSGVILESSPRYGSLQIFRKEMSRRGINAQVRVEKVVCIYVCQVHILESTLAKAESDMRLGWRSTPGTSWRGLEKTSRGPTQSEDKCYADSRF